MIEKVTRRTKDWIKSYLRAKGWKLEALNSYNDDKFHLMLVIKWLNIQYIIDVGANRGQFGSDVYSSGYEGSILSIEPLSEAWAILKQQTASRKNWHVHDRCALGEIGKLGIINIAENLDSSSILDMMDRHIHAAPWAQYTNTESCEVRRLDDIFFALDRPQGPVLLKIDSQGYEYNILQGAQKSLKEIAAVITEVSLVELYRDQRLWLEVVDLMDKSGFSIWSVIKGFVDYRNGQSLQLDVIFVNRHIVKNIN